MHQLFEHQFYYDLYNKLKSWVISNVFVLDNVFQFVLQLAVLLAARLLGTILGRWVQRVFGDRLSGYTIHHKHIDSLYKKLLDLIPLLFSIFILWIGIKVLGEIGFRTFLMRLVLNLSVAWVAIQLVTSVILDLFWGRLIATFAWSLAALNIIGFLDETIFLLERIGFTVGEVKLTLLSILKAFVILMILLRGAKWLSGYLEQKLNQVSELTPSTRLMITKSINIFLWFIVTLVVFNSVGIDLTALAVFSGAVGVGVGFGLQKVVGNFISGLILLSDKSIKPGDVVELGDVYGLVKHMGGRCVSVITRDEKEYLIPNEDLITQQVINWSYSSKRIRIKAPIGISYNANPHRAIDLIKNSFKGIDRILNDPAPKCLLIGFGDNSVDLQLRFWVEDPQSGISNITSEVLLRVWDTLKENGIEIPYPQRDVHLDVPSGIRIINNSD